MPQVWKTLTAETNLPATRARNGITDATEEQQLLKTRIRLHQNNFAAIAEAKQTDTVSGSLQKVNWWIFPVDSYAGPFGTANKKQRRVNLVNGNNDVDNAEWCKRCCSYYVHCICKRWSWYRRYPVR
jgi:hypothetical protein